jgi:hypothetical protein
MKEIEIEKLRQLVSRTDMTGNQKVDWLVNFIDKREQALRIHDVVGRSEQLCGNLDQNLNCKNMCLTHCVDGNTFWK